MEKLIVKNFKAIEYAEIEVNDLTFFIGQQASGKSTLAKLIYFFKTLGNRINDELDFNSNYNEDVDLYLHVIEIIKKTFYYNFSNSSNDKDLYIEYITDFNKITILNHHSFHVSLLYQKKILSNLYENVLDMQEVLESGVSENNRAYKFLDKKIEETIKSYFPTQDYIDYLPANRSLFILKEKDLISIRNSILTNFKNFLSSKSRLDYNSFSENDLIYADYIEHVLFLKDIYLRSGGFNLEDKKLKKKIESIIIGNYVFDEEGEKIILTGSNKSVKLQDASSGQQEVIRLVQDIFAVVFSPSSTAFRVYEEPEAHLFPASQKALMEMIVILLNSNTNVQLLISTHTPYLLAVLNVLMEAKELEKQLGENNLTLNSLVPKEERLDVSRVCVYSAKQTESGKFIFENVVNQETQSIDAEIIDKVSEEIGMTYNQLLDLRSNLSNSVSK